MMRFFCISALVLLAAAAPALRKADTAAAKSSKPLPEKDLKVQEENMKKLFAHLKDDISKYNKGEAQDKTTQEARIQELTKKIVEDHKQLEQKDLRPSLKELYVNRTREDERQLEYWKKGRDLEKKIYRTNLQATHGLMNGVKGVLEAYDGVLKGGKLTDEQVKKLEAVTKGLKR
eukprot:TRINITY_DN2575_c0_g1_i1.p2 TRINITY_DN2575_c0_g1~~TRINITY_DN2575_c0_g1_i1.p2  ORF type:complete len:175 (+),score=54.84 TRINITY_DN2575_c0_g1_i1:61-585(+)